MGRPCSESLLPTFDAVILEQIRHLRGEAKKVGPQSIYAELCQSRYAEHYKIPKPSTIAYFLKKSGLASCYEKHYPLPNVELQKARYAHQVWQLDGQGAIGVPGVGRINFLNIKDLYSGVYCASRVVMSNSHNGSPSADDYRNALRHAFAEFGLPEKVQVDHASAFYENKGKSPFPTRFHLWLLSLGIDLVFSRKYRPTDQAVVERMHQTIENQVIGGQSFCSLQAIQKKTDKRRKLLNYHIPAKCCGHQAPLVAHPQAKHSGSVYCPNNERALINFDRVFDYLSKGKWIRQTTGSNGRLLSLGGVQYYVAGADKKQKVEITFDRQTKMLQLCMFDSRRQLKPQPIKKLNYRHLQGDDFIDVLTEGFQFQIPFQEQAFKRGTTFLDLQGA